MSDKERKQLEKREECSHNWKPAGTTKGDIHLKLICSKCGETTLVDLFP